MFFFWLGYMLRKNWTKINHIGISSVLFLIADVVLWFVSKRVPTSGMTLKIVSFAFSFVLNTVGAIMAFLLLQTLASFIKWERSHYFKSISSKTMTMFLFHQQIIYVTIYILNGKVDVYSQTIINFLTSCIFSFLLSVLLLRWKPLRFLLGEK